MDGVAEVMARPEAAGTERNRKTCLRQGAPDPMFGQGPGGATGAGAHA